MTAALKYEWTRLVTLRSTEIQVAALATTRFRYSRWWPRHGRGKTL